MVGQTHTCAVNNSRFDGRSFFDGSLCHRIFSALILRSGFDARPALDYSALPLKFRPQFHGSLCARSGDTTIINDSYASTRFNVKWAVERHPCRRRTTDYRVIPPRSETGSSNVKRAAEKKSFNSFWPSHRGSTIEWPIGTINSVRSAPVVTVSAVFGPAPIKSSCGRACWPSESVSAKSNLTNRSTGAGSVSGFSDVFRHGHVVWSFEAVIPLPRQPG